MSASAIKKNDKARDIFCGTFDWRNVTMPRKLKRTDFCFWDKSITKDTYSVIVSVHFSNSAFIEVLKFTKWEFSLQSHIASLAHLVFFSHSSNLSWPLLRKGNTEHAMKFDNCALLYSWNTFVILISVRLVYMNIRMGISSYFFYCFQNRC